METQESETDIVEDIEALDAEEETRTDQGPEVELTEKKTDKGKKSESKESEDIEPGKVLEALEKTAEKKPEKGHNFDKGLQSLQKRVEGLSRKFEESLDSQKQLQDLLTKVATSGGKPTQDDLDALSDIDDDDFTDGKTFKKGIKALTDKLSKDIDAKMSEMKQLQEKILENAKPAPRAATDQEIVEAVAEQFPDLDGQYIPWVVSQANPAMEQFNLDNPKASREFRQFAANRFLTEKAEVVRAMIRDQSKGSAKSVKGKPENLASTKIVDDSASPATTVKQNSRSMLDVQDAMDKWLNVPE